ncbi:Leucine-rich repeat receptor-like protein kinase PXC2 [Rhizoctonia solani]|uniref:Leucine-rich repeat receptor-like protein kinase PXC2 n=1 Tax=Rhizoctonia solani TaxID=456999 RepID=A0A0K6FQA8_9AGAM|nr:Leucine-rich repeat receptor-like protein kinase PXC2 [Rhizoctonia solani]
MQEHQDAERGLNILCIDGGGVRGLSPLIILQEIIYRAAAAESKGNIHPHEYFDIISGTGTGGISACMLGRLRMPIDKAISEYATLAKDVFQDTKLSGTTMYKATKLQVALKRMVQGATGDEGEMMNEHREHSGCKTVVFAMARHGLPILFRSYAVVANPGPGCTISEALHATMAHPDLFKSITILESSVPVSFVGGEIGCSNPIAHVLHEAQRIYPDRRVTRIISIGAGHARTIQVPNPSRWYRTRDVVVIKDMATDSERVAEEMAARFEGTENPSLSPVPTIHEALNNIVTSSMSCEEIVTLLKEHGCTDLTGSLDESTCSKYPVANGGIGDVFSGNLLDGTSVAIKTIRTYHEPGQVVRVYHKRAAREIYTWSKCKHPNIVPLIGLAVFHDGLAMISRWEYEHPSKGTSICAGLAYLHEHDIANVLISQDGTPMLMDFGNASLLDPTLQFTQTNTRPSFSLRWTAPEILTGISSHSATSDIYSLGMTILETFTSQIPFVGQHDHSLVLYVAIKKNIPIRPEGTIPTNTVKGDKLWAILTSCWSYDPKDRPTADTVWNKASSMKEITAEDLKEIRSETGEQIGEMREKDKE